MIHILLVFRIGPFLRFSRISVIDDEPFNVHIHNLLDADWLPVIP